MAAERNKQSSRRSFEILFVKTEGAKQHLLVAARKVAEESRGWASKTAALSSLQESIKARIALLHAGAAFSVRSLITLHADEFRLHGMLQIAEGERQAIEKHRNSVFQQIKAASDRQTAIEQRLRRFDGEIIACRENLDAQVAEEGSMLKKFLARGAVHGQ